MGQFQSAPRNEWHGFATHAQDSAQRQHVTRLIHRLVPAQDLAGQDQRARPLTRRRQSLLENRYIRAHFAGPSRDFGLGLFGIR
jgi:hypothetical protein